MKRFLNVIHTFAQRYQGQSLVEAALMMPVLILLIAGVVEVSHLAVTQNRISTAARSAARFAANGGEDNGVRNVALNTVTQTLDLSEGLWDIWVIRATVDENDQIPPADFSPQHIYGQQHTQNFTATNTITRWNNLRLDMEEMLLEEVNPAAEPDRVALVGVLILHDIESILGLDVLPNLVGFSTVRGFSVMRRASLADSVDQSSGCRGVFPIIVDEGARSITEAEFDSLTFSYPGNPPEWEDFTRHQENVPLINGQEGYIYRFTLGTSAQSTFSWLQWNTTIQSVSGGSVLAKSIAWPGNSADYEARPENDPPGSVQGFIEAGDPTDQTMHANDFVAISAEGFGSAAAGLQNHIDTDRALRLPRWDFSAGGYDSGGSRFRISGFAVFRLRGYGSNWILAELYRIDNACGQPQ